MAAAALMVAACSSPDDNADDDGLLPAADAGPAAPDSTRDVAGAWSFSATRSGATIPFLRCDVTVGGGVFDVSCPQGEVPRVVHDGCSQLRDDLHLNGSLSGFGGKGGHLDGMIDDLVEYEGDACVSFGYTTGAPYPLPAFAQLSASQTELEDLGTFLRKLGGRWDFTLDDTRASGLSCAVSIGVDLQGVKVTVGCPTAPPVPVATGCTEQELDVVTAHVTPGQLDGDIVHETRREGTCTGQPPAPSEPIATIRARAE
jgi:hypothetical protein